MSLDADVVIIGGGFAGITAARKLVRCGRSVVLLEARDRLGGRTWTKESSLGRPLEMGGTWVHWIQPHVWAEIVQYDLPLVPSPAPEQAFWLAGGRVRQGTPEQFIALLDPGMTALLEPAMRYFPNPHLLELDAPELKAADAISFRGKLGELDVTPEEADVLDGMWALNFNGHPENSAWTQGLRWAALSGGSWQLLFEACATYKLGCGTRGLLEAIAADAHGADIRLDTRVTRVEQSPVGVTVTTAVGEAVTAREAIVTLTLNALAFIDFAPALHPVKRAAAEEGQASTGCKFWARVQGELPPFVALATSKEPMTFAQLEYRVEGDSIIVGFGPDASILDVTDREAVEAGLRQWLPDVRVLAVDSHDWVADPYARETWPMLRPGQLTVALTELQAPESRVRLAGSDYAVGWAGFIDGAIESGKRAARRVLCALTT